MPPSGSSRSASRSSRCGRTSTTSSAAMATGAPARTHQKRSSMMLRRNPRHDVGQSDVAQDALLLRFAARQALALHPPDQEVDTVLTEERLVLEYEGRHAPMAGCGVRVLVALDDLLVAIGVGAHSRVHRGEIEARSGCRLR